MKRYRVFSFDLDTRASILNVEISPSWEPDIQEQWSQNQRDTLAGLIRQFGESGSNVKINNFKEMGNAPLSIIAFHNRFLHQIRSAFVIGA